MALTETQQAKLNALLEKSSVVWQKAGTIVDFCRKVQERADDMDLNLTEEQKIALLTKATNLIDEVKIATDELVALKK